MLPDCSNSNGRSREWASAAFPCFIRASAFSRSTSAASAKFPVTHKQKPRASNSRLTENKFTMKFLLPKLGLERVEKTLVILSELNLAYFINRVNHRRFQEDAVLQYHSSVRQGGEIGIHSGLKTRRR